MNIKIHKRKPNFAFSIVTVLSTEHQLKIQLKIRHLLDVLLV